MRRFHFLALGAFITASGALAVDGVVEINQARALAGNVTPGDMPGFPVTLSRSGSYRLTSNLDVRALASPENITAISVTTDDVTIDMNGFAILGPTICSGAPVTFCTPSGSGNGIDAGSNSGFRAFNGTIRGMGSRGILAGGRARLEWLRVESNRYDGITLGNSNSSIVSHCIASSNGQHGVNCAGTYGGSISFTTAESNMIDGIVGGQASAITDCTAIRNGGNGLAMFYGGGTIRNSVSHNNTGAGINTTVIGANMLGAVIVGNSVRSNAGGGLVLATGAGADGYSGNVLTGNSVAQITGGVSMGTNLCNGAPCP